MPFDLIAENNGCSILTTYSWTIIFLFTSFTGLTHFFLLYCSNLERASFSLPFFCRSYF